MWIFDSYFKGCVELWSRERGLERISAAYPPSFYMHLKDPHAHWEMIQALESRFRVEECSSSPIAISLSITLMRAAIIVITRKAFISANRGNTNISILRIKLYRIECL